MDSMSHALERLLQILVSGRATRLWLALALLAGSPGAARAVPTTIPYVGQLSDLGAPYEGAIDVRAALYDDQKAGTQIWPASGAPAEFMSVMVLGGALSLALGDATQPLTSEALAAAPNGVWLQIWLHKSGAADWLELTPRQHVLSVPYAILAADAERLDGQEAAEFATTAELAGLATSEALAAYAPLSALTEFLLADGSVPLSAEWDLGGLGVRGLVIAAGDAPEAPLDGALWFDDMAGLLNVRSDGQWVPLDAPDLSGYATLAALAEVALSGDYADLAGTPDPAVYATAAALATLADGLAAVATSGQYADLGGVPDLSAYATLAALAALSDGLAAVATSGQYADLADTPDLAGYATSDDLTDLAAGLADVATTGSFADLAAVPAGLADGDDDTVAALLGCEDGEVVKRLDGAWACGEDIYATGTGGPVAWDDVSGKPTFAPVATSGTYGDLAGTPDLSGYAVTASLAPVATSGAYDDLAGIPDLSGYAVAASLAPVAASGSFADIADVPGDLADGDDDSLAALAECEDGHVVKWSEGAWACGSDLQGSGTAGPVSWADVEGKPTFAPVATSGAYADLTGTPELAGYATTASLAAVATSGSFGDLGGVPSGLADGDDDGLGALPCAERSSLIS